MAVIYATVDKPCFYLNLALWSGIFQSTQNRRSLGFITSKASPTGWNLSPHFELSTPLLISGCQEFVIDPFMAFDWANNWQSHYHEHGSSGFNLQIDKKYASVFRGELGFRFFETFCYQWGELILEEKISYINRTSLQRGRDSASFIGAFSSFDIETLDGRARNLGAVQLHIETIPATCPDIYASIDYQGEFGSSFQSNMLTLTFGKLF